MSVNKRAGIAAAATMIALSGCGSGGGEGEPKDLTPMVFVQSDLAAEPAPKMPLVGMTVIRTLSKQISVWETRPIGGLQMPVVDFEQFTVVTVVQDCSGCTLTILGVSPDRVTATLTPCEPTTTTPGYQIQGRYAVVKGVVNHGADLRIEAPTC